MIELAIIMQKLSGFLKMAKKKGPRSVFLKVSPTNQCCWFWRPCIGNESTWLLRIFSRGKAQDTSSGQDN